MYNNPSLDETLSFWACFN